MTSPAPLVSIVIATYNAAAYLPKTLSSLELNKDIPFELLVADGGSSDETNAVLDRFQDLIGWRISEKDNGVYDAWNKAIPHARAPWIAFLGAGDVYEPGAMKRYAAEANQHPEADYICADQWQVNLDGKKIRRKGEGWNWNRFRSRMTLTHVGNWHAQKAFDQYGLFNTGYKIAGDYEWLLRAGKDLKVAYIPEPLVQMLVGGISDRNWLVVKETAEAQLHTARCSPIRVYKNMAEAILRKQISRWVYQR